MNQSLIDFYLKKTGKKRDEVTHLEYEAIKYSLEYMEELSSSIKEEVDNLNPKL